MLLKNYKCSRFAGLKDKDVEFKGGLNVILGPNEAGKSTLVEGIHASLFKSVKLKMSSKDDKDFKVRFMPYPDGDFIDCEVKIDVDGKEYSIKKEWGENSESILTTPDGRVIKNEASVQNSINEIFMHGEGTYSSIVFAKQREIKESISRILQNSEATSTISSILRKTIMELDGISVEKLKENIDDEINKLLKRWDFDRNYPENNRGANNPFLRDFGQVVGAFYNKENLRIAMDRAQNAESQFEEVCARLKEKEKETIDLKKVIDEMAKIEGDVLRRVALEPSINMLERDMKEIADANREWPRAEVQKEQLLGDILKLEETNKKLQDEIDRSRKFKEKDALVRRVTKIEEYTKGIEDIKNKIYETRKVTKENIQRLETLNREMLKTEAAMKAGVMLGKINSANKEIWVTRDLGEREKLNQGEDFNANGYIKIEYEGLEIELRSGEFNFEELKDSYLRYKEEFEGLLKELNVASLEEAKLNRESVEALTRDGKSLSDQQKLLLGDDKYEELVERLKTLQDIEGARSEAEISKEIKAVNDSIINSKSKLQSIEGIIKEWVNKYSNQDKLLDILLEKKAEKKKNEDEIQKLAPLPEAYSSAEEFKNALSSLRRKYDNSKSQYDEIKQNYYEREKDLPESSYEELKKAYYEAEKEFAKKLERGKKLLKIRDAFNKILEDMDKDSFKPLVDEFSKYLSTLTMGSYKLGNIDEGFNVEVKKNENDDMPIELLSTGTYDSVALSLRFAMLKYIFKETPGFVILDDCLVDLDPERKEMAVKLIKDFAKNNQVIFTTCSQETANLLGGNIINM